MRALFIGIFLFCVQSSFAQKISRNIYFDFAKSDLNAQAIRSLNQLYDSVLNNKTIRRVYLYGYCDSVGKSEYNDSLSIKRVNAVKKYFKEKGIHDSLFKAMKGYGKQKPLNKNLTEKERQANRRVEILITYDHTKPKFVKTTVEVSQPVVAKIDTAKLVVGNKLILKNINFEGGLHRFLPSSEEALEDLLQVMTNQPKLEIMIIGYICCQTEEFGDGIDNETGKKNLSEARAKAVYDFLVANGINKRRLAYKGMGARNKLVAEITEADKSTNRRVEILILKK